MQTLFEFLEKYLMGPMGKLSQKQFVRAIMAAGMATIPFTIVGSALLIINILPLAFPFLESIWDASFNRFTNLYMLGNTFTLGSLALYFNIVMGFELTNIKAKEYDLNMNPLNGALLSMMAFLMTLAQLSFTEGVFVFQEGESMINGIAYGGFASRLGSSGIFTGILMAVLAVWCYKFCVEKNIVVKLPDVVPAGVSRSFTALIPCFMIVFVVIVLNGLLVLTGYDLFSIISVPFSFLASIADTWYGVLLINLFIHTLWSVGIHGANIISALYSPFTLANLEHNMGVLKGTIPGDYTVFAGEFQNMFVQCGGSGATLGMCIWMCWRARSEQLSVLGKASIAPALFNINEPLVFGVPIIYNPNLIIPFILAPSVVSMIAYFGIHSGIFPPIIAQVPWPTPPILGGFLGTASFMGALLAVICIAVAFLIYLPFLKNYDNKLVEEEKQLAAENEVQA